MNKDIREQEAKVRASGHSGLREAPAVGTDPPWRNHLPVDPQHLKEEK